MLRTNNASCKGRTCCIKNAHQCVIAFSTRTHGAIAYYMIQVRINLSCPRFCPSFFFQASSFEFHLKIIVFAVRTRTMRCRAVHKESQALSSLFLVCKQRCTPTYTNKQVPGNAPGVVLPFEDAGQIFGYFAAGRTIRFSEAVAFNKFCLPNMALTGIPVRGNLLYIPWLAASTSKSFRAPRGMVLCPA